MMEKRGRAEQSFARIKLDGTLGKLSLPMRMVLPIQWALQLLGALLGAAVTWPLGRHRSVSWLIKAWANAGKLTGLTGRRYSAYA